MFENPLFFPATEAVSQFEKRVIPDERSEAREIRNPG